MKILGKDNIVPITVGCTPELSVRVSKFPLRIVECAKVISRGRKSSVQFEGAFVRNLCFGEATQEVLGNANAVQYRSGFFDFRHTFESRGRFRILPFLEQLLACLSVRRPGK